MMRLITVLGALLLLMPELSFAAEQELKLVTMQPGVDGSATYSTSLQILLVMTMLSLLPAILMTMTSFTRIIVVLAILRQALGTMQTPSNQILIGLALFTSMFIELCFEIVVDTVALQVESANGIRMSTFWAMWRKSECKLA